MFILQQLPYICVRYLFMIFPIYLTISYHFMYWYVREYVHLSVCPLQLSHITACLPPCYLLSYIPHKNNVHKILCQRALIFAYSLCDPARNKGRQYLAVQIGSCPAVAAAGGPPVHAGRRAFQIRRRGDNCADWHPLMLGHMALIVHLVTPSCPPVDARQ